MTEQLRQSIIKLNSSISHYNEVMGFGIDELVRRQVDKSIILMVVEQYQEEKLKNHSSSSDDDFSCNKRMA